MVIRTHAELRQMLEGGQARLQTMLSHEESWANDHMGYGNHMADDGTDAFEQAVDVALQRQVESTLEKVEQALTKLDNGTFGLCEACGARIDRARLEALPRARNCLSCQSRKERNGIRRGAR